MDFGEKEREYNAKLGKDVPVWQTDRYKESKTKAEEIINSGKYGLTTADFWILMNATKSGKMAYTGLIISHNGCLKINDKLDPRFDPSCVSCDKNGYNDSLTFTYNSSAQGIYEVGEVSKTNCSNAYPYAMAYKRLFDRVVLKLSKLAYAGIYSDSESDEFARPDDAEPPDDTPEPEADTPSVDEPERMCSVCGKPITPHVKRGKTYETDELIEISKTTYGRRLCWNCMAALKKRIDAGEEVKPCELHLTAQR